MPGSAPVGEKYELCRLLISFDVRNTVDDSCRAASSRDA